MTEQWIGRTLRDAGDTAWKVVEQDGDTLTIENEDGQWMEIDAPAVYETFAGYYEFFKRDARHYTPAALIARLRADVARLRAENEKLRAVYMDLVDHEFEPVCDEYDDGGAIMADGAPQCAACGHPLIVHSAAEHARAALTPQLGAGLGAGEGEE